MLTHYLGHFVAPGNASPSGSPYPSSTIKKSGGLRRSQYRQEPTNRFSPMPQYWSNSTRPLFECRSSKARATLLFPAPGGPRRTIATFRPMSAAPQHVARTSWERATQRASKHLRALAKLALHITVSHPTTAPWDSQEVGQQLAALWSEDVISAISLRRTRSAAPEHLKIQPASAAAGWSRPADSFAFVCPTTPYRNASVFVPVPLTGKSPRSTPRVRVRQSRAPADNTRAAVHTNDLVMLEI